MLIAIPADGSILSQHFGRCQSYHFFKVDPESKSILEEQVRIPPPHEPGVLPAWVSQMGADLVVTGGMGPRAVQLFQESGVEVLLGAPSIEVRQVVESYLDGSLKSGDSSCDHNNGGGHHCH